MAKTDKIRKGERVRRLDANEITATTGTKPAKSKKPGQVTFEDVQALFTAQKWSIEKDRSYPCRRFIIKKKDGAEVKVRYNPKMDEMKADVEAQGVEAFAEAHVPGEAGGFAVEGRKRGNPEALAKARLARETKSVKVTALRERKNEVVLGMMRMSVKRGSPEHKKLRAELDEVRAELADLKALDSWARPGERVIERAKEQAQKRKKVTEKRKKELAKKGVVTHFD